MSNDKALATTNTPTQLAQFGELSVQGIVDRKRKILEVMDAVMKEGEHYGKIPGCGDKPGLFKAGAEILATTFALAPKFKITRTDLPGGHREYEITCTMFHIPTGLELGEGVGCCSTMESKYRWRAGGRTCPECGKAGTIIKGKADYGGGWLCFAKKGGCGFKWADGAKEIEGQSVDRIENPDPADQYNTVLKMAKKRAQVDATLTVTGASDLLTQDLEDLPAGSRNNDRDIVDAEFVDRPNPPSNGNAKAKGKPSNDDKLHEIALDLIADMEKTESEQALEALAPRFSALPKGTAARKQAYDVYQKRKSYHSQPQQQTGAA